MTQSKEAYSTSLISIQEPILIVDDDEVDTYQLEILLRQIGYSVITAQGGKEAIEILAKTPVCLIICDQRMPGMDGLAVLKEAQHLQPEAMRILLTGIDDSQLAIDAINTGRVVHFLRKPIDEDSFSEIVTASLQPYILLRDNRQMHESLLKHHDELMKTHIRLEKDIELGERIYEQMLIGKAPGDIADFDIAALTIPSRELDGDFFEFFRPVDSRVDLVIGDVMGKGIPAALIATALKLQFSHFAFPAHYARSFEEGSWSEDLLSPEMIVNKTFDALIEKLISLEYFTCVFYASFDLSKSTFTFFNCGLPPLIYHSEGVSQLITERLPPFGMLKEDHFIPHHFPFKPGDIFVFFSDGVCDAMNKNKEQFGNDRIIECINQYSHLSSNEILEKIRKEVFNFTNSPSFEDDFSLIIIKISKYFSPHSRQFKTAKFMNDLSQLAAVRDYIKLFCEKIPGDAETFSYQMQLAIDEIFTNIVRHGFKGTKKGEILINGNVSRDGVRFNIFDQGDTFDPSEINEPDLSGDREGGYGWFLVKKVVDKMTYSQKKEHNGWNHLSLSKHFLLNTSTTEIHHEMREGILIITPDMTSLDLKEGTEFESKVSEMIRTENANRVLLDLSKIQFIDTAGFSRLLMLANLVELRGGVLKLISTDQSLSMILRMVSMEKSLDIFEDAEEAIASFKKT